MTVVQRDAEGRIILSGFEDTQITIDCPSKALTELILKSIDRAYQQWNGAIDK